MATVSLESLTYARDSSEKMKSLIETNSTSRSLNNRWRGISVLHSCPSINARIESLSPKGCTRTLWNICPPCFLIFESRICRIVLPCFPSLLCFAIFRWAMEKISLSINFSSGLPGNPARLYACYQASKTFYQFKSARNNYPTQFHFMLHVPEGIIIVVCNCSKRAHQSSACREKKKKK